MTDYLPMVTLLTTNYFSLFRVISSWGCQIESERNFPLFEWIFSHFLLWLLDRKWRESLPVVTLLTTRGFPSFWRVSSCGYAEENKGKPSSGDSSDLQVIYSLWRDFFSLPVVAIEKEVNGNPPMSTLMTTRYFSHLWRDFLSLPLRLSDRKCLFWLWIFLSSQGFSFTSS